MFAQTIALKSTILIDGSWTQTGYLIPIGIAYRRLKTLQKMDPGKSIDDQFCKLHPCLPVNTRIGIVGGGPSGLSTAYALAKLGYRNVTLLEKYHSVGGMCESVEIEGTK